MATMIRKLPVQDVAAMIASRSRKYRRLVSLYVRLEQYKGMYGWDAHAIHLWTKICTLAHSVRDISDEMDELFSGKEFGRGVEGVVPISLDERLKGGL